MFRVCVHALQETREEFVAPFNLSHQLQLCRERTWEDVEHNKEIFWGVLGVLQNLAVGFVIKKKVS